jgi:hypothetical protein
MTDQKDRWLDAVSAALAHARATLACFGVRDAPLEIRIDAALAEAVALKSGGFGS